MKQCSGEMIWGHQLPANPGLPWRELVKMRCGEPGPHIFLVVGLPGTWQDCLFLSLSKLGVTSDLLSPVQGLFLRGPGRKDFQFRALPLSCHRSLLIWRGSSHGRGAEEHTQP